VVRWKWGCGDACRIHRRSLRRGWRESLEDLVDVFRLDLVPRERAGGLSDAPVLGCGGWRAVVATSVRLVLSGVVAS